MSQPPIAHTIFLTLDQVMVANALVPIAFTEDDIVHYVMVEQAQLFPTLDQDIYFDFLITSIDDENKKIVVVACNTKDVSSCASTLQFLKVSHEEFNALNLLPWRQREKKLFQKKQQKTLFVIGVIVSIVILVICLWFFYVAHQDEQRLKKVTMQLQEKTKKLTKLEVSYNDYQQLQHVWKNYSEIAQQQENLEKILIIVESRRPAGLFFGEMQWREKTLSLTGYASNGNAVKSYIALLEWSHIQVRLKFLKNYPGKLHLVKFEVFIEGVS